MSKTKTFTRKDVEELIEIKLAGRKLSGKIISDTFFESLNELLMQAQPLARMEIRGFGVFEIKHTRPKPKARNLKTGEFIFVPGRRKIHFKPGRNLKEFLKTPPVKDTHDGG